MRYVTPIFLLTAASTARVRTTSKTLLAERVVRSRNAAAP